MEGVTYWNADLFRLFHCKPSTMFSIVEISRGEMQQRLTFFVNELVLK